MEEQKNEQNSNKDLYAMQEIMLKQQSLLLQQFETMSKMQEKAEEKKDEIDLKRLVPGFLRRKKKISDNQGNENLEGDNSDIELNINAAGLKNAAAGAASNVFNFTKNIAKGTKTGFFTVIRQTFNYLGNKYIESIGKMKTLIWVFVILGFGYGIYKFMTDDKLYRSSMLIDSGAIEMTFYEALINSLNKLAGSQSYNELARKLNITPLQAEQVVKLEWKEFDYYLDVIKEETDSTDAEMKTIFFTISATVKDNSILPVIQDRLFVYMSQNIFAANSKEIKKAVLSESIIKLESELNVLDSLKMAVVDRIGAKNNDQYFVKEANLGTPGGIILSQNQELEVEPLLPFERSLQLQREQIRMKSDVLKLESDFKLIDDFAAINNPVYPGYKTILYWAIVGTILGSGLGFLIFLLAPAKTKMTETEISNSAV